MKWIGNFDMSLADITSVVAGTGLSGGGTTGAVTLNVDASIPEITTLAGLTSFGSAGATTNILAGDIDWYNPVADGNPTLKFGFDDNERFKLQPFYSGSSLATVFFTTTTASGTANMGKMRFQVDGTSILDIDDTGINLDPLMGISIDGTFILRDNPEGTATLSNIDDYGTIGTGVWNGSVIASAYLDADTAHLTTNQTFTGTKTFDGDRNVTPGDGGVIHVDAHEVTDTNTSASGTAALYTHVNIEAPRLIATNASVTTTAAATLYIKSAPTAGTNQTLTNAYSLWVDSGLVKFDGNLTVDGNIAGTLSTASQTNITGVGTIGTGVWNGTAIATAYIADDAVTFAKASGVSPNVYGSIIKLLPSDFAANIDGGNTKLGVGYTDTAGSAYGMKVGSSNTELFAFVSIPEGMKATHVDVFDKDDRALDVFEVQINATSLTSKGSGNCNTTLDITDVNATATNFLAIKITTTATTDKVFGGQVTIAPQ